MFWSCIFALASPKPRPLLNRNYLPSHINICFELRSRSIGSCTSWQPFWWWNQKLFCSLLYSTSAISPYCFSALFFYYFCFFEWVWRGPKKIVAAAWKPSPKNAWHFAHFSTPCSKQPWNISVCHYSNKNGPSILFIRNSF